MLLDHEDGLHLSVAGDLSTGSFVVSSVDPGKTTRPLNIQQCNAVVVGWLLNVPATCECISGTDLLRQFYALPH